jgi:ABC-2 type transport system ATP-binding protein
MLSVQNISKSFNKSKVLDDVSFQIKRGKIFGLLGPNGAGKTTTIKIILNIFNSDSGKIFFDGKEINERIKTKTGYLPEKRGLYSNSKVKNVLVYFAELKGLNKSEAVISIDYWLKKLRLLSAKNKRVGELSKGNQQLIQFAASILHHPDILILDEPYSGLDPRNQNLIETILKEYVNSKKLILLSTHQLEAAENLCDEILLLNNGKMIKAGNVKNIKQNSGKGKYLIKFTKGKDYLLGFEKIKLISITDDEAVFSLKDDLRASNILRDLTNNMEIESFIPVEQSLRNIFLNIINKIEPF